MKIKFYLLVIIVLIFSESQIHSRPQPKLVVGIVVDQMRYDYLYRFQNFYGKNGFNRLLKEGSNFTFAHYNYSQTSTALGHATIYTGTTPFYHGIIGNDWYDRLLRKKVSSVNDLSEKSIGAFDSAGFASPRRLLATTITDQLKISTGGKSKVVSISLKNRSAILPGGHLADEVFWFSTTTGNFITSTYYSSNLPVWVAKFNEKKISEKFLNQNWNLSRSINDYEISGPDESANEEDVFNECKTSFPHSFKNVKPEEKFELLQCSPFGNMLVEQMAIEAIENENLGNHEVTDFLAISFSSTDIVAHSYGSQSFENQDTYIKLDESIANLLNVLDAKVGRGNYLLFLSADHAGMETPGYSREHNLPTGGLNSKEFVSSVKNFLTKKYGVDDLVEHFINRQIFLNRKIILEKNLNIHEIETSIADYIRINYDMISVICTRDQLEGKSATREPGNFILNGFNPAISGDITFDLKPGLLPKVLDKGTTHGSPYAYDTHVPIIFFGWNVPAQTVNTPVYIVDIAPTVANMLKIMEPSACIGIPLIK